MGEVARKAESPAAEATRDADRAKSDAADVENKLEDPKGLQQRIDHATGVEKAGQAAERTTEDASVLARKHKPNIVQDPTRPAGHGSTDKYGNITVSPHGTAQDRALVLAHEKVHSALSPKWINQFREFRADVRMLAYQKSALLKYTEEALAETIAQVQVKGLGIDALVEGIRFRSRMGM